MQTFIHLCPWILLTCKTVTERNKFLWCLSMITHVYWPTISCLFSWLISNWAHVPVAKPSMNYIINMCSCVITQPLGTGPGQCLQSNRLDLLMLNGFCFWFSMDETQWLNRISIIKRHPVTLTMFLGDLANIIPFLESNLQLFHLYRTDGTLSHKQHGLSSAWTWNALLGRLMLWPLRCTDWMWPGWTPTELPIEHLNLR